MKYNVYVSMGGIEFEVSGSYVRGGGVPPVGPELDVVSVKVGGKEIECDTEAFAEAFASEIIDAIEEGV